MAMTMKTIVSAPCDQYRAVTAITIPRAKADTKVPLKFPIPPTMTTAKLSKRTESPEDLLLLSDVSGGFRAIASRRSEVRLSPGQAANGETRSL